MSLDEGKLRQGEKQSHNSIPDDVDPEIREIVRLFNSVDGVRTLFSCAGHGEAEGWIRAYIHFKVGSLSTLEALLFRLRPFSLEWDATASRCCCRIHAWEHEEYGLVFSFVIVANGLRSHREILRNLCRSLRQRW